MKVHSPTVQAQNIKSFCEKTSNKNLLRGCTEEQLKKIATYIEEKFIPLINKNTYSVSPEKSGLAGSLEYDKKSKKIFIHFKGEKVGEGWWKRGSYTLLYDPQHPLACIRLVLKDDKIKEHPKCVQQYNAEIGRSQKLQHKANHIVKTLAAIKYTKNGKEKKAMIQKFYSYGTLSSLIDKTPHLLTTERKIKIATGILKGLKEVHDKEYIHRDLHAGNVFVDKNFKSCLGDFGRATRTSEMREERPAQTRSWNTAPELLCPKKPTSTDYKRGELFSAGLNLYKLSYGKPLKHTEKNTDKIFKAFTSNSSKSDKEKSVKDICNRIHKEIDADRKVLLQKIKDYGEKSLTPDEKLKYATVELLHTDPKTRKTAEHWIKFLS